MIWQHSLGWQLFVVETFAVGIDFDKFHEFSDVRIAIGRRVTRRLDVNDWCKTFKLHETIFLSNRNKVF